MYNFFLLVLEDILKNYFSFVISIIRLYHFETLF